MVASPEIPAEFVPVREAALREIAPIKAVTSETAANENFLFDAQRTEAGDALPPYYLVYFLLVDLLGFENLGRFEKIAWSVPIDYEGKAFLIEHRKFGIGVFAHDLTTDEDAARQIVSRINKAVKVASPYFDWLAEGAAAKAALNVNNNSSSLFDTLAFFLRAYREKALEAHELRDERIVKERRTSSGESWTITMPFYRLDAEARYLALAAIEAFFSWTEHVFIHLAILMGAARTGEDVAELAEAEWGTKFKRAIDLTDHASKSLYDQLITVRQELRNFVAHGAFGKQGEAFEFHSRAGAVPMLLPHRAGSKKFRLGSGMEFDHKAAIKVIDAFMEHLWSGARAPAKIYIESHLPTILTNVADGTYATAMKSEEAMAEFVDHLSRRFDDAANMDW